jgi:SdrD B-like domain
VCRLLAIIFAVLAFGITLARAQDCAPPHASDCPLFKTAKAIFVGTVTVNDSLTVRFHVTEAFEGIHSQEIDLSKGVYGFDFRVGEQYLVFATHCYWQGADRKCLTNEICGGTRSLREAAAILQQLRAEKIGQPVAKVYGTLTQTVPEDPWEPEHPLANIVVRLQSDKKSFATKTDDNGAYAFQHVSPGTYRVSADLPAGLVLGDLIGGNQVDPVELPRRCCFENDLHAWPSVRK